MEKSKLGLSEKMPFCPKHRTSLYFQERAIRKRGLSSQIKIQPFDTVRAHILGITAA